MTLKDYADKLTHLSVGRVGSHERPHKPVLLLAIASLVESGCLEGNRIEYGPELLQLFRRLFEIVRTERDDPNNMLDPFWRLRKDGLLNHQPRPGFEQVVEAQSSKPTAHQLSEMCTHSSLPDELYELLQARDDRDQLREAIISRYFASHAADLRQLIEQERGIAAYERQLEDAAACDSVPPTGQDESVRDQAFRRVVLRAYDYRCTACGLRVVLDDLVLVDAAHLIPFSIGHDDDPRNGLALCKNHHWAMDQALIAPTVRMKWRSSRCLDDRIEGQRDLIGLNAKPVIPPKSTRFQPKEDSLRWRQERLRRP